MPTTTETLPSYRPIGLDGEISGPVHHCRRDGAGGACWGQVAWFEARRRLGSPNGCAEALCEGHIGASWTPSTNPADAVAVLALTGQQIAGATREARAAWALAVLRALFEGAGVTLRGWRNHRTPGLARYSRDGRWAQVLLSWHGAGATATARVVFTVDGDGPIAAKLRAVAETMGLDS